jgi:hypothetical protein
MNIMVWDAGVNSDARFTVLFEGHKAYIIHDIVDETLTEPEVVNLMAKGYTTLAPSEVDVPYMNTLYKKMSPKELPTRVQKALKKVLKG